MFYDPASNMVVYPTRDPEVLLGALAGAIQIDAEHVAVPCTLSNLQALTEAGAPTIALLDKQYDWPHAPSIRGPHTAQRVMANFMALHPKCFNLSEMRTGKTLASLWAADFLMRQSELGGLPFRALIVAPLRTLRRTWAQTLFEHFWNRRKCVILHGTEQKRLELLNQDADFYIINPEGLGVGGHVGGNGVRLQGFSAALRDRKDIKLAILDESTAFKSVGSNRYAFAKAILYDKPYMWLLSGTPISNSYLDAFAQAKFVNNANGLSYGAFKRSVMTHVGNFSWVPKADAEEKTKQILSPAVRFTQADCFDATPCVVMKEEAPLSPAQMKAYKTLKKELRVLLDTGQQLTAINSGVLRWKLAQIACGAVYGEDKEIHEIDAKPRLTVLKELLENAVGQIIILAPLTSVIDLIYKHVKPVYTCVIVDGRTSNKMAEANLNSFQSGATRILLAHPGPIARGLDLTAASTIIWYAPTDKTEDYIQANQRINGPKQKNLRTIVQISASAVERECYNRLEKNESLQDTILKMLEEI